MAWDGRKTLVVDFDGVLHSYTSRWSGADVVADGPVEGAMDFLVEAVKSFRVAISSSRSHEPGGIDAMQAAIGRWLLDSHGVEVARAVMDELDFPTVKPPAHLTLDDRALTFTGTFPSMAEIYEFRPWNKR